MSNRKLKEYLIIFLLSQLLMLMKGREIPYMMCLVKATHKTNKITDAGSGMASGITMTRLLQHTKKLGYMQIT